MINDAGKHRVKTVAKEARLLRELKDFLTSEK